MKTGLSFDYNHLKQHVENQSALEKLLEDLKHKIDLKQATPEVWLSFFMLLFANMEDQLRSIVKMIILDITKKQNSVIYTNDFLDLTFGQTINIFENLFLDGKYILRSGNKIRLEFKLNLQRAGDVGNKTNLLFSIPYLTSYTLKLRWFSKFRNDLYHNLFSYDRGKNINQIVQEIQSIIDLDFLPDGTYNTYEFDTEYYANIANMTGFERSVELKRKSLIAENGAFPPDKYVSLNMILRIIFYHYSFTFMGLKEGIYF